MQGVKTIVMGVGLLLIAAQVSTAALISDDFESYTQNSTAALNPPWTTADDPTVQGADHQSPFGDAGDDQGLRMKDTNTADRPEVNQGFSVAASSTTYVQFDFYSVNQSNNSGLQIRQGTTIGVNLHIVHFNEDNPRYNNGSGFQQLNATVDEGQWYRYTLTIDPVNTASDTFDLRVQTLENTSLDKTFSDLSFQNDLSAINDIRFHFNVVNSSVNGEYRVDNVLVTTDTNDLNFAVIPSPAALPAGLVMLGMMTLRRRR